MAETSSDPARDPRLLSYALSPTPAWLWALDGSRLLWANAAGAETFKAANAAAAAALRFTRDDTAAVQIARLAGTLPANGDWRLERLRGFGGGIGGAMVCQCARLRLADGTAAVLVVAGERAGTELPLDVRLHRFFADNPAAVAAFSGDGRLIAINPAAGGLRDAGSLAELGAQGLGERALREGHAEGRTSLGDIALDCAPDGDDPVLLLSREPDGGEQIEDTKASAATAPTMIAASTESESPRLRFIWQTDADERFAIDSDDFVALLGPGAGALLNRPWPEIASAVDPDGVMAAALADGATFSGVVVEWPVDGERIALELSGIPIVDGERKVGYRGFGICSDMTRLRALAERRATPPAAEPVAAAHPAEPQPVADAPQSVAEAPAAPDAVAADESRTANVLPFPAPERPALSDKEASAFNELARALSDRLNADAPLAADSIAAAPAAPAPAAAEEPPDRPAPPRRETATPQTEASILDRLPVGVLVYRLNDLLYANRAFLDWTGYGDLQALRDAGGLDSLFIEAAPGESEGDNGRALLISTPAGEERPVQGRLLPTQWNGDSALVLMLDTTVAPKADPASDRAAREAESENRELKAVLDTAVDGVILFDRAHCILSANSSAQALFGFEQADFATMSFIDLFAPDSKRPVLDYIERIMRGGAAALMNHGLEVTGRVRRGGLVPLHMSIGQIEGGTKYAAVFRDMTAWKRTEEDLVDARRQAEAASAAKSDFLARISHEIRTPLNAIVGFSEVMMEERFGPIGSDRYRQYLRDIHAASGHLISLLNELLDLSKIEAGRLDLTFAAVNLNDLTQQCVAIMQQQANRERVIVRTSLAPNLPQVLADARSIRQIVLNLLSNSIKFTGAGGQVIVSTGTTDSGGVVLRVRDTGGGMSEQEVKAAVEPFGQAATASRWGVSGSGLGLPIARALAEANHATFRISSTVRNGTLAALTFPAARIVA
jgi:PAS domain S-box-containing protein